MAGISTGYRGLAPARTYSEYLIEETSYAGQRQQLRKACDKFFDLHKDVVENLYRRVDALRTSGRKMRGYEADPPSDAAIDRAIEWIKQLYLDVHEMGRTWLDPLITASEESEAMFEWERGARRLAIRITEGGYEYSKMWGDPPHFHFEDGFADTPQMRSSLWAWLTG
jgi:hypothetical protein